MLNGFFHHISCNPTCPPLGKLSATAGLLAKANYHTTIDALDLFLRQSFTLRQAQQIHAHIVLGGAQDVAFLASRLISIYSKFDRLPDAESVFRITPFSDNSLLWNSILRARLCHERCQDGFSVYVQMRELRVAPNGFTFPLVIKACASIGSRKTCQVVHCHVVIMGFGFHLHVGNELIGMYSKLGQMQTAQLVFEEMAQRNIISWNVLITGFAMNLDSSSALQMLMRMEREGLEPNAVTWTSILSAHNRCRQHDKVVEMFGQMHVRGVSATPESVAVVLSVCSELGVLDEGKAIHGYAIVRGIEDYPFVQNSLVGMYGKNRRWLDMKRVFSELKVKNLVSWNVLISSYAGAGLCNEALDVFCQLEMEKDSKMRPNVISWSSIIGGFASCGRIEKSLELFSRMIQTGESPNPITIGSILSGCADSAALNHGREMHCYVIQSVMDKNILVENGLIYMYTKSGSLQDARLVFDAMGNKDLISWNSMIAGYGMHGYGEDAISTFWEMTKTGLKPDGITFTAILSACSHAGLLDDGRQLFTQMIYDFGVVPKVEHYACYVDLLGRAGFLQEANELVKTMPVQPNAFVWGALLNACRIYKNMAVGEETISEILSLDWEMPGCYMLASNLYAACGKWDDSARVRVLVKAKGLKKSPGNSWIEVKKKVYRFSAGNALEPVLDCSYNLLHELSLLMEAEGYVPDESFVLHNVDGEEKRQVLYGHSEKLAIAFGHANLPLNMPIRVMKNLRVCGDCHNWTKFFSKVMNRQVIVRDGYRFHHFVNGSCSCRDYW